MTPKTRILFVHHYPGMGGATMSLYYIMERLDKSKYDAHVLFLGNEGEGIQYFREKGIKVMTLTGVPIYPHADNARLSFLGRNPLKPFTLAWQVLKSIPGLVDWLKQHPFDIVHLNTSLLLPFGKAAHLAGAKVVWHIREPLYAGFIGIRRSFIQRWIKKYADLIFTIYTVEAQRLGKSDKIVVVNNYVDFNKFDSALSGEAIRKEFHISASDFVIFNLGGVVHSKGAEIYIAAAALLANKIRNIKFFIVGDTKTVKPLTAKAALQYSLKKHLGIKVNQGYPVFKLIKKFGLEKMVILTGMRTEIPEILAASDVLAWTATVPHFARPIIEASAMGKPVVASDFPSTHEAMREGVTGLVFEPANAKDLACKLEILYNDKHLRHKMGTSGKLFALEKFNAEKNFKQIEEAYQSLMTPLG